MSSKRTRENLSVKVFTDKSSKKDAAKFILAVGGGALIDRAKIYAKKNKKYLIACPCTGAGASETSHAVKWGKTKINIPTDKPISIPPPFKINLSKEARINTIYDILGHIVDYLNVCTDNEIVEVGIYAGKLIEKHPTNLTHPLSYFYTLKFGMPHGEAVGKVLPECIKRIRK